MKALSVSIVLLAIGFFLIGGLLVWQDVLSVEKYALVGGVLGSIASTIGLLAFASPRLTGDDIRSVEGDLIQNLANAAKSLEDHEKRISANITEIEQLERDKLKIELLVRQASAKVFLEEKLSRLSYEVNDRVLSDSPLKEMLIEYENAKESVEEIDGEITTSDRAELIYSIVEEIHTSDRRVYLNLLGRKIDVYPLLSVGENLARIMLGVSRAR